MIKDIIEVQSQSIADNKMPFLMVFLDGAAVLARGCIKALIAALAPMIIQSMLSKTASV